MHPNSAIIDLVAEAAAGGSGFKARAMFGGHGLYLGGVFFATIADGVLFFKVSDETRPGFEAEGSKPFSYTTKTGEHALVSYWRVPERLYDDMEELARWIGDAVAAARAAGNAKKRTLATLIRR